MEIQQFLQAIKQLQHIDSIRLSLLANEIKSSLELFSTDYPKLGHALYRLCEQIMKIKDVNNENVEIYEDIICEVIRISIKNDFKVGFDAMRFVFNINAEYYKTANLDLSLVYPIGKNHALKQYNPQIGEQCDVIRPYITSTSFCGWTRCTVLEIENNSKYTLKYANSTNPNISRQKPMFAPLGSRTKDFEWRMSLDVGSPVEALLNRVWYKSTIAEVGEENGTKKVRVTYRRFDQNGDRQDSSGNKFFGLGIGEDQWMDVTSSRIQQCGKMVMNKLCYYTATSQQILFDDSYDIVFEQQFKQEPFYGIMRIVMCKSLSLIKFVDAFVSLKGIQKTFEIMENVEAHNEIAFQMLSNIAVMVQFFPRMYLANPILRNLYNKIFSYFIASAKFLNVYKLDMGYFCYDMLGRRLLSLSEVHYDQNQLKKALARQFLKMNMEKQMFALRYLNDLISPKKQYTQEERQTFNRFLKDQKIFEQIFNSNVHEQIISRSGTLLQYLIQKQIISIQQFESLWKIFSVSDTRGRSTIQKLLAETSKNIPLNYIQFLIQKILSFKQSELTIDNLNLLKELKNREIDNESQNKILSFLWDLLTIKSGNVKENIQEEIEKVFKAFVSTIKDPKVRMNLLESMCQKLQECKKIRNQIQLLKDFVNSFPKVYVKEKGEDNIEDYIPLTIFEAVNFLKSKGIYPGLISLLTNTKDETIKKDILGFFGFLFENDMSDVNEIIRQIYKTMGPSLIFLEWVKKNMSRSMSFINQLLEQTTDFSPFENIPSKGFQAIQGMIIDVNCLNKKIKVVRSCIYKTNSSSAIDGPVNKDKQKKQENKGYEQQIKNYFFVLVSPFQLTGMKFLQNLLQAVKQSKIYNLIIKLIIQLISNLDESIEHKTEDFRREFLNEIIAQIKTIEQQKVPDSKSKTKLQVFINLFQQIFSETQKNGLGDIKPHFESVQGEMLNINIVNMFNQKSQKKNKNSLPKFCILCNQNQTLWKFKQRIGEIILEKVEEIDVIKYSDPMSDTNNGKSLTQLLFYDNESIKIDKTKPKIIPKGNLLNENGTDVSPKLLKIIELFFNFYKNKEVQGLVMTDLEKMQNQCWKYSAWRQNEKLKMIMDQYDKDKKGFLSFDEFKLFFYLQSKKSEGSVWKVLNLSGFRNDFTPYSRAKHLVPDYQKLSSLSFKTVSSSTLPRKIISTPQFYTLIYSLLENQNYKQEHTGIYSLLCMLETDQNWRDKISENINKIIGEEKSYYILCYILQIFNSELSKKGEVYYNFWKNGGISVIDKRIREFGENKIIYENQSIVKNVVIPSLLKIINMYVRELLSDSKLVRFISVSKINHFEPKDFIKKVGQMKIDDQQLPLTEVGKKLRQLENYEVVLQKLYDLNDFILQNLMKNYGSEKAEYLQKLTVQAVRLVSCLVSSSQSHHRFHPSHYLHGITNGSLNYRRSSIIIIYISLFFSKSKNSNEIEQIILEMFENMPKQNKYEFEEYFIFLGELISRYLNINMENQDKDAFFVNLGNRALDTLLNKDQGESRSAYSSDKIIAGILSIVSIVIKKDAICKQLAKRKGQITQKCLFAYGIEEKVQKLDVLPEMLVSKNQSTHFKGYVLCKTEDSRENTYKIISRLHQVTPDDNYLNTHILPIIKSIREEVRLSGQRNIAVGLKNFGSTCYMNSMLQVLNSLSPFRNSLIKCKSDNKVIQELKKVFAALYFSERIDYAPFDLLNSFVPPINPAIQQDTTQFLNFLCDQLETALANTRQKKLLDEMFKGANTVQMICHSCGYKKQNKQQFFCLGVEIEGKVNLESALQGSHQGEIISDYLCDSCKNRGETTKRNLLSQIPSVLFIHLRRIVFNYDMFVNMKIHTRLHFPEYLNIQPFTKEGVQLRQKLGLEYMKNLSHNEVEAGNFKKMTEHGKEANFYQLKLKGIIVHSGSADVGHYYSILETDKIWRKYDDSRIGVFTQSDFENYCYGGTFVADQWGTGTSANAYVLVYEKVVKNQLQFFPEGDGKQTEIVKYDDIKDYNTPEDYRSFWLDNHQFMLETQLLDSKLGRQFIKTLCNLLTSSKNCENKIQIIAQTIYRIIYHSQYIGDLLKITIENANNFDSKILYSYVLKDKARTFKLLMSYERSVRDYMSTFLHICLMESYKKGDDLVKMDVLSYIIQLLNVMVSDVAKNWMRIDGYFKLLNNLVTSSISFPDIWKLFVSRNLISTLIDFIMQKQSPVKINPKNYSLGTKSNPVQFSYALANICFMLKHTYGFTGKNYEIVKIPEQFLFHLNHNDVVCLSHMEFYRKMFAERQNLYELAGIIHRLCLENLGFSRAICQVLLECMNSITDSKDEMLDFCYVCLEILRIKDQFWVNRAQMLLGIGLPSVLNQNLMVNFDEQRFAFTSTIYDIFPVECLFSYSYLYRLKNTLACFQIVQTIIKGCSISDESMRYLIQQPSPNYLFSSLFSWMENFVHTFITLVSVEGRQKKRIEQQIANTIKYIEDIKQFMFNNSGFKTYKPLITGQILNKKQIQKIQQDGVQIRIFEYQVYCFKSSPTAIGGNTAFEPYLQQYKKAKSVKKQSDIFKFLKNPGKAIALKLAPVQENEDKQLLDLFDEAPSSLKTTSKPQQIPKPEQKNKEQPQPQPPVETSSEPLSQPQPEMDIQIGQKFSTDYFRQIEATNISKDKKIVSITFNDDDQTNFIVPKEFIWKMHSKSNQSLWIAKQNYEQKWSNVQMRFKIEDYVKEKHEKKNINSWNFKIYNNQKQEFFEEEKEQELEQKEEQNVEATPVEEQSKDNEGLQSDLLQCQICTYLNPATNSNCQMCSSPLF